MKWRIRTPRQIHQPTNDSSFKITVEGIGYKELSWSKGGGRGYQTSHNMRGLSVCALLESGIFSLLFFFFLLPSFWARLLPGHFSLSRPSFGVICLFCVAPSLRPPCRFESIRGRLVGNAVAAGRWWSGCAVVHLLSQ